MYGANKSLLDLIEGLRFYGHQFSLVIPEEGMLSEYARKQGCEVVIVPIRSWFGSSSFKSEIKRPARLAANLLSYNKIKQFCKHWKPDIIHTNSSVVPVGAWAAASIKKPHVWHIREMPLLHYELKHDWGKIYFKFWFNKAAACIAISKSVKHNVCSNFKSNVYVIHDGVLQNNDPLLSIKLPSEEQYGVFSIIGLTSKNKCQSDAIRAISLLKDKYPGIKLLIAGDDPAGYINVLKQLVKNLNVTRNVEFLGYVSQPISVYEESMAVLMCSKYEALGRVTVEAMAAGRPVVGNNSGATPEMVDHGITGYIYDGSVESLAEYMEKILLDPEKAKIMGQKGRSKALEMFTIEKYCEKINKIYTDIISNN